MDNNEDKLDKLLGKLRVIKPELIDAEVLTSSIVNGISEKSKKTTPQFLIWIRTISSAAAVLLLGLYLFQQTEVEASNLNQNSAHLLEFKVNIDSSCIQISEGKRIKMIESYYCYLQQNSIENNRIKNYKQLTHN
jgi:hypothetical protein